MRTFRAHIETAIRRLGSQAKLAEAMGCSQQQISYLLNGANSITAEMAIALEKATLGEIDRRELRPDIFAPSNLEKATS